MLLAASASADGVAPAPVNVSNFARAESDLYFGRVVAQNGLGKLGHERTPVAVDNQKVIRMNRDTLYSSGVFDLSAGSLTVALPEGADKRFMSMQIVNEDHFTPEVAYGGTHTYTPDNVGTRYVFVILRTFINPDDPKDVKAAHAVQDNVKVEQSAPGTWEPGNWDKTSLDKARGALLTLGSLGGINEFRRMGAKGEVDPVSHLVTTAQGWGLNPSYAAVYVNGYPKQNDGKTVHRLTMKDVPVDGFWSLSVYNREGYFEKNDLGAYSFNSVTAQRNADDSATIQFGGCEKDAPNCLPITEGWNYTVRLYRPRKEILDGTWKAPEAQPAGPAQ
ncbi:carboxylesterase [Rhizobium sp. L18]|nr:carboxylesterase [Rhizobium sp. L18]